VARPEFWDLYDPDELDMPTTGPTDDPHSQRLLKGIEAEKAELSEEEIRNARHGYYANTSYFDSNVGKLGQALKEADLFDNTIVIVTSDHGDMLGERGLWYKMHFYEHSVRVPLIMHGPGVTQGTHGAPVSLVDLLPTFVDIAASSGGTKPEIGMPIDGETLWPMATGEEAGERTAYAEYCAEMAAYPMLMIRRGDYKYIHCEIDPPQLFNVATDPMERLNLAEDPDHSDLAATFAAEAADHWNATQVHADVIANQKQRRTVHAGLTKGEMTSWDYAPRRDAANEFVRNHVSWDDVLHRMQYPAPGGSE
jgi:choline-sulfatase